MPKEFGVGNEEFFWFPFCFGIFFGLFCGILAGAIPEHPEFAGLMNLLNTLCAWPVVPYFLGAKAYASAAGYRRWHARERLLRVRGRSRAERKIFGVWFNPAKVSMSRGGIPTTTAVRLDRLCPPIQARLEFVVFVFVVLRRRLRGGASGRW